MTRKLLIFLKNTTMEISRNFHVNNTTWEQEINHLVSQLYGLTEEEIQIIENKK